MAGAKGRSGGSNRKSAAIHLLQGSFREDRHGSRAAALATMANSLPVGNTDREAVPDAVVAGLGDAGRAFVTQAWQEFTGWSVAEAALLNMAGRLADDVVSATDARARRQSIRAFAAVVNQLGLGRRE